MLGRCAELDEQGLRGAERGGKGDRGDTLQAIFPAHIVKVVPGAIWGS